MASKEPPLWDNPLGTDGFEFVEYAAPDPAALGALFEHLGFTAIARHRSKNVLLYRQGEINFIVNAEPGSFAQAFARVHGPSICAIAPKSNSRLPLSSRASDCSRRARRRRKPGRWHAGKCRGRAARTGISSDRSRRNS